jgi:hypothetical protein
MAVFAAIPKLRTAMAKIVKPGLFTSIRMP